MPNQCFCTVGGWDGSSMQSAVLRDTNNSGAGSFTLLAFRQNVKKARSHATLFKFTLVSGVVSGFASAVTDR